MPDAPNDAANGRPSPPAQLTTAAGIVAVQGILVALYGIADVAHVGRDRLFMGIGGGLFFLAYGAALIWCAFGIYRLRSWSRGPVLFAELIWLGVAWSYRGSPTTVVAVMIAVSAAIVLAGLLSPRSVDALNRPDDDE